MRIFYASKHPGNGSSKDRELWSNLVMKIVGHSYLAFHLFAVVFVNVGYDAVLEKHKV